MNIELRNKQNVRVLTKDELRGRPWEHFYHDDMAFLGGQIYGVIHAQFLNVPFKSTNIC